MTSQNPSPDRQPDRDRELFLEAIAGRKMTMADVIGQCGGDFLKGESPVPKLVQLKIELKLFLNQALPDSDGALLWVLQNQVDDADDLVSQFADRPLLALQGLVATLIDNPGLLTETVRQADFRWGQIYDERPHFDLPGRPTHPDDPYTHASVRQQLTTLLGEIDRRLG
ncbi:MAG: hypothetical protein ACO36E_02910 [Synechocystis sp.]|jgi:hypothetical protein